MAHELTVYGDNDTTPLFSVGTDPAHANPFLQEPSDFAPSEVDLHHGRATIGWGSFRVIDPEVGVDKQQRWMTGRLGAGTGHSALIRRRVVWTENGAVRMDGIISSIALNDSFAGFTITVADVRDRAIDVPAFNRTETSTVLPRGIRHGFGKVASAQGLIPDVWLVPPTEPLRATYEPIPDLSFIVPHGRFRLHGRPLDAKAAVDPRIVLTDAMRQAARVGPAPPISFWSPAGVYDRVILCWRPVGGGAWNEIRNMAAFPAPTNGELLEVRPGRVVTPDGAQDIEAVAGIRANTANGGTLPASETEVEVMLVYSGDVSEEYPLHIEGTFGAICCGELAGSMNNDGGAT
jgi:hypothetical protein